MSGYIYAMQAGDFIKFGWAKDITKRRLQLQTGCPHRIEVIATAAWPRKFEHAIHAKLNNQRTHGEWFSVGGETNEVVRLMHQDDKEPIAPFLDAKLSKQGCVDGCRGKIGSGLISLFMEDPMTSNEQKVLAYLVSEVSSGSEVHIPNSLISKNTSLDKSTICRVLQSLGQKGVVVQRESKQDRWAPVLVINPSVFYVGTDEGLEDAISDFDLLRLTVVK